MSFGHCLVLVQTSIPVTLFYTLLFGTNDWLDIAIISLLTLILGYLVGSTLYLPSLVRLYCGTYVTEVRKRVTKPIIIFDIENDPRCIAVRECLSVIDAPVLVYPIPIISKQHSLVPSLPLHSRFLHEYRLRSGQQDVRLPFLEDPNTGVQLCGDREDIIMYLYVTYCRQGAHMDRQPPLGGGKLEEVTAGLVQRARAWQPYGTYAQPSLYNRRPLRLFAHEGDADSKLVRERLCSLQLHYEYVTCAQGGAGRVQLVMEAGRLVLPVLHDMGTGVVSEGAEACVRYLDDVYAVGYAALGTLWREAEGTSSAWARKREMLRVQSGRAVEDSDAEEESEEALGEDGSVSSDWGDAWGDEDEDEEDDDGAEYDAYEYGYGSDGGEVEREGEGYVEGLVEGEDAVRRAEEEKTVAPAGAD